MPPNFESTFFQFCNILTSNPINNQLISPPTLAYAPPTLKVAENPGSVHSEVLLFCLQGCEKSGEIFVQASSNLELCVVGNGFGRVHKPALKVIAVVCYQFLKAN